jgi:hypothetical protein
MAMGGPGGSQCDTTAAAVAAVRVADAPHRRASALPGASGSLQVLADSVAVAGPAGPGVSNVDCSRHRPRPSKRRARTSSRRRVPSATARPAPAGLGLLRGSLPLELSESEVPHTHWHPPTATQWQWPGPLGSPAGGTGSLAQAVDAAA